MDGMAADSCCLMDHAAGYQLRLDQLAKQYQGHLWFVDSDFDGTCSYCDIRERSEEGVDTVMHTNRAEQPG